MRKHTLAVLVNNRPGVLARIAGLYSRRGFNIESVAVGKTEDPRVSRMTFVVEADECTLEQITKQLNKLIDVIKVSDITNDDKVDRELALIKVNATTATRSEIVHIASIFRAQIIDVSQKTVTIEITGAEDKIDAMQELLSPYGIRELVRTGKISMVRGPKATKI
jgi:acetolactate synthase-1/3 small subunit